ncbi:MAG: hypothetical protein JWN86_3520 [Planctomycetota bacterium]|nr:hypothetical protein [Planctomycetota bacterium]
MLDGPATFRSRLARWWPDLWAVFVIGVLLIVDLAARWAGHPLYFPPNPALFSVMFGGLIGVLYIPTLALRAWREHLPDPKQSIPPPGPAPAAMSHADPLYDRWVDP